MSFRPRLWFWAWNYLTILSNNCNRASLGLKSQASWSCKASERKFVYFIYTLAHRSLNASIWNPFQTILSSDRRTNKQRSGSAAGRLVCVVHKSDWLIDWSINRCTLTQSLDHFLLLANFAAAAAAAGTTRLDKTGLDGQVTETSERASKQATDVSSLVISITSE